MFTTATQQDLGKGIVWGKQPSSDCQDDKNKLEIIWSKNNYKMNLSDLVTKKTRYVGGRVTI